MYKAKAKRISPGKYALSYGRGSKKIEAIAEKRGRNSWEVVNGTGSDRAFPIAPSFEQLKLTWGAMAEHIYNSTEATTEPTAEPATVAPTEGDAPTPEDLASAKAAREWHYSDQISLDRLVRLYGADRVLDAIYGMRGGR